MLDDVACILVHHRSWTTLASAVQNILAAGVPADALLIVDNSEQSDRLSRALAGVDEKVSVVEIRNRGFGNAVNVGLSSMKSRGIDRRFTVVATHEVLVCNQALSRLRSALLAHSGAAAAGPSLVRRSDPGEVWSLGGSFERFTKRPRHRQTQTVHKGDVRLCEWLDGAFVLYRTDALVSTLFREDYFLYFEETDCHQRLRRAGYDVIHVAGAVVAQDTAGVPPYLHARNTRLFLTAHGNVIQRNVTPLIVSALCVRNARSARDFVRTVIAIYRGLEDGWRHEARQPGAEYEAADEIRAILRIGPGRTPV